MTTTTNETFVILDLETTGLDHERDQIIEIAALKVAYDGSTYREIGRFQTLVALEAGRELSEEITGLTGITAQMLEGAPTVYEATESLRCLASDSTVIAHNAPFDLAFLSRLLDEPGKFICTRAMAKLLGYPSAKLSDLYRLMFDSDIDGHHRAMSDVEATLRVFKQMRSAMESLGTYDYRNVVVDSPERPLRFVPNGARVVRLEDADSRVTMGGEKVA